MKKLGITIGAILLVLTFGGNVAFALPLIQGDQGGTGFGIGNMPAMAGQCLQTQTVGTHLVWTVGTCGSGGGSSATTTINGVSGPIFTFNTSSTGSDFTISTSTGIINFNLPTASASNRGALSSADWTTFNGKQPAGSYITALTGDGTASGPGSSALTLATVNANIGTFGTSSTIPIFTVNAKGLITAASATTTPFLISSNNLLELTNTSTARTNIGLNNTLQNCGGGQFVNSLSATSTIGCGTPSGGGGSGSVTTSSAPTAFNFPYWFNTTGGLAGTSTIFYSSSTSNVGIGTTVPTSTLSVSGTVAFSTSATTPLLIGGGGINDDLTFKSTTGNGLAGTSKMNFLLGNNGNVTAMTISQAGSSPIVTFPGTTVIGATGQLAESSSQLLIKETSGQAINLQAGTVNFQTNGGGTTYFSPNQFNITIPSIPLIIAGNGDANTGIKLTQEFSGANARYLTLVQPNGGNEAGIRISQITDSTNASFAILATTANGVDLTSTHTGTASTTPIRLLIDSNVALTVATSSNIGIGTSAPSSTLHVVGNVIVSATTTLSSKVILATTTNPGVNVQVLANGHMSFTGGNATTTSCGTTPVNTGNDIVGTITIGSGVVTSCTLNFSKTFTNIPVCTVSDDSSSVGAGVTSISTSSMTIGLSATLGGGHIYYNCFDWQ